MVLIYVYYLIRRSKWIFVNQKKKQLCKQFVIIKNYILITSTNPDSIYQDHIDYLNKLMPFNRKELESNGEQISKLIVPVY
ncbi:hypothetical protein D6D54_03945 [Spiroplasma poulsonii]|uniref:Uncharacterized protein n=1 Tax=Spiroplasma poulsonii TaxID=2138 RepID=A0A433ERA1_9MOLU|nr:hypothetical protein D6D54_03945 [Spiroplasma poulsonii]